jgi:hypothetical protein
VQAQPSQEVDATRGPWQWFVNKGNSSIVQRHILPWLIAVHGIEASKQEKRTVLLPLISQMMIAVCDELGCLQGTPSAKDAADKYPIAFADVCDNALSAASKYIPVENPSTLYIALTMRAAPQSGLCVLTGEMCGMSSLPCSRSL